MSIRIAINREINVTAVFFKNQPELDTYPRRIEYDGRTYTFSDGMSVSCEDEGQKSKLFTMKHGKDRFKILSDERKSKWMLLGITKMA